MSGPGLVELHLWTVPGRRIPQAFRRMAEDPAVLRTVPGLTFHKSLGTGAGRSLTARDADLRRWALLTCWRDPADRLALSPTLRKWQRIATTSTRLTLQPLVARGLWSGQEPFGDPDPATPWSGPVAAITRARIGRGHWRRFQAAVPPVATDLDQVAGLDFRIGIGEAPVGLQGTFSIWRSAEDLVQFAHRRSAHIEVVKATRRIGWYQEELFARFGLVDLEGDPLW